MAEKLSRSTLLGKVDSYTKVLEKDPKSKAFIPLASTLLQLGRLDEALEVARRGEHAHPNSSSGLTVLGRIQAQRLDFDAAVVAFQRAIDLDDQNIHALNGLSRLLLRSGDREGASALIARTLTLKPGDPVALKMQRSIETAPPGSAPAVSTAATPSTSPRAGDADSSAPIATATIAEIYIGQGYPEKALKVYRDLLRANPYDEKIRQKLVDLKKRLEDAQGGREAAVDEAASEVSKAPETPADGVFEAMGRDERPTRAEAQPTVEGTAGPKLVQTYEKWLAAIARRRGNV